jgi:tRNA pseudouridine synthase 10
VDKISEEIRRKQYDSTKISLSISVPSSVIMRQSYHWAHQGDVAAAPELDDLFGVKDALRVILSRLIQDRGALSVDGNAEVKLSIDFEHEESMREFEKLGLVPGKARKDSRRAKWKRKMQNLDEEDFVPPPAPETEMRASVLRALQKMSLTNLAKQFESLKSFQTAPVIRVSAVAESVFISGRYRKLSRELSQTPWIIDGDRKTESSVQDEIVKNAIDWFKPYAGVKFQSAGREDSDVRMLGNGRDFLVEFCDPTCRRFDAQRLLALEKAIKQGTTRVDVLDLRVIEGFDADVCANNLKAGEESKRKLYRAVVWFEKPYTQKALDELTPKEEVVVNQGTPIRVCHRRTLMYRRRSVHNLKFVSLNPHFAMIDLETQAGTYIKEFVHGDRVSVHQ